MCVLRAFAKLYYKRTCRFIEPDTKATPFFFHRSTTVDTRRYGSILSSRVDAAHGVAKTVFASVLTRIHV